jgi:hypothetical protein
VGSKPNKNFEDIYKKKQAERTTVSASAQTMTLNLVCQSFIDTYSI